MLDMLPTERIGRATWLLAQGRTVTVRELAADAGDYAARCYQMPVRLSRVLPIADEGGWREPAGGTTLAKWRGRRRPARRASG